MSKDQITPVDENEIVIQLIREAPDSQGRHYFCAHWLADNVGPTCSDHGVRGQHFISDVDRFAAQHTSIGMTVRYVEV